MSVYRYVRTVTRGGRDASLDDVPRRRAGGELGQDRGETEEPNRVPAGEKRAGKARSLEATPLVRPLSLSHQRVQRSGSCAGDSAGRGAEAQEPRAISPRPLSTVDSVVNSKRLN